MGLVKLPSKSPLSQPLAYLPTFTRRLCRNRRKWPDCSSFYLERGNCSAIWELSRLQSGRTAALCHAARRPEEAALKFDFIMMTNKHQAHLYDCCVCLCLPVQCHSDCTSCSGTADHCESCRDPQALLHRGRCLSVCPAGFFADGRECAGRSDLSDCRGRKQISVSIKSVSLKVGGILKTTRNLKYILKKTTAIYC